MNEEVKHLPGGKLEVHLSDVHEAPHVPTELRDGIHPDGGEAPDVFAGAVKQLLSSSCIPNRALPVGGVCRCSSRSVEATTFSVVILFRAQSERSRRRLRASLTSNQQSWASLRRLPLCDEENRTESVMYCNLSRFESISSGIQTVQSRYCGHSSFPVNNFASGVKRFITHRR